MALSGDIDKPTPLKLVLVSSTFGLMVLLVPVLKFTMAEVSADTEKCLEKWYRIPRKPVEFKLKDVLFWEY